jgi:hypothetical protein
MTLAPTRKTGTSGFGMSRPEILVIWIGGLQVVFLQMCLLLRLASGFLMQGCLGLFAIRCSASDHIFWR